MTQGFTLGIATIRETTATTEITIETTTLNHTAHEAEMADTDTGTETTVTTGTAMVTITATATVTIAVGDNTEVVTDTETTIHKETRTGIVDHTETTRKTIIIETIEIIGTHHHAHPELLRTAGDISGASNIACTFFIISVLKK